ncbi:hypothetical protein HYC85_011360 [Camellia sinensis]|uniref:Uncharacterized protein n=1 Tax=Camellia sinensis TaxID=4442 RepID=A0A7J7HA17_CAMSI|nr:hypothetical protein HYC85_011360 [Camellia sinensis]
MDRDLAVEVISDTKYFPLFRKHCKSPCCANEHYLPTFVSIRFSERNSNKSLTRVDWSKGGLHPAKFVRTGVTIEVLEKMRSGRKCEHNGNITNISKSEMKRIRDRSSRIGEDLRLDKGKALGEFISIYS